MPATKTTPPKPAPLHHERYCTPPAARETGPETEPRIEVYPAQRLAQDGVTVDAVVTVTRCLECGAQETTEQA